jgi:hypothetical protein
MRTTFTCGATICDTEVQRQQIVLRVRGLLGSRVMPRIAEEVSRIGVSIAASSIVVDLTGSVVTMDYDQLMTSPTYVVPTMLILPVAIVCRPIVSELFREYAWGMAKLGLLRGVFFAPEAAAQWAGSKAAVLRCRTQVSAR